MSKLGYSVYMSYSINAQKFLNDAELNTLTSALEKYGPEDERNYLLLQLLLKTGARAQEALNVLTSDLDDSSKTVLIRGIKGSADREIPLTPKLYAQLKKHAAGRDQMPLFNISYSRLRQVWDMYKPSKKSLHSLRHTFAINLFKKTKDIRLVQVALGHKSINNTLVYSAYVYEKDEMRKLLHG